MRPPWLRARTAFKSISISSAPASLNLAERLFGDLLNFGVDNIELPVVGARNTDPGILSG